MTDQEEKQLIDTVNEIYAEVRAIRGWIEQMAEKPDSESSKS